jgi:predicted dehydrogenase
VAVAAEPAAGKPPAALQVAFVGVGHVHTPGFIGQVKKRTDVRTKYVWDHDADRAQKRAAELGAEAVADRAKIWSDPDIAAVIICSETNRHEALVTEAAAAKKPMYVEKPLGMGARDATVMADAIEKAGVLFTTGYAMRGDPVNQFLRDEIGKGDFGTVTRVRKSVCHAGSLGGWFDKEWRWMADPKQAGVGGFGDLGTHGLDILMWLFGDVARVTASIHAVTHRYDDCDEFGEGIIEFKSGVVATLAAGWLDLADPMSILVSGTEGNACDTKGKFYFQSKKVPGADGKEPWAALPPRRPHPLEQFLDGVGGKKDVQLIGAREAAARCAVMEALYRAAAGHTWVEIGKA